MKIIGTYPWGLTVVECPRCGNNVALNEDDPVCCFCLAELNGSSLDNEEEL